MIRPERFARLVTLAGSLIGAAREEGSLPTKQVLDELNISIDELREDLDVLNVVNFGGGTYVLYAEIVGDRIEVDPDTYGDNFARPRPSAAAGGEGAGRGDRPLRRPPAAVGPADRPHEDRRGARPRPLGGGPGDRARTRRLLGRAHRQRGDPAPPRARAPVLQGERGRLRQARGRALPAGQGPRGLVPRLLRPRPRRHPPLPPRPDEGGDDHRPRVRAARGRRRERSPSRSGSSTARSRPPASPASGSRPTARAGCASSAPWSRSSPTAPWWSSCPTARATGWPARSSRASATWSCSSRPRPARPCSRPSRG